MAQVELEKVTSFLPPGGKLNLNHTEHSDTDTDNSSKSGQDICCSAKVSQVDGRQPGLQETQMYKTHHTQEPTEPNMTSLKP